MNLQQTEKNGTVERFEQRPVVAPPVDIYENKDEILVVTDVPGATADGVTVRLEKNELVLHARRTREAEPPQTQGQGRHPHEGKRRLPDYGRTFLVPRTVDPEKIEAALKDGVLTIRLPKAESAKPRQIAVRAG